MYNMLKFAAEYHAALDIMAADCNMKLRKFELSNTVDPTMGEFQQSISQYIGLL